MAHPDCKGTALLLLTALSLIDWVGKIEEGFLRHFALLFHRLLLVIFFGSLLQIDRPKLSLECAAQTWSFRDANVILLVGISVKFKCRNPIIQVKDVLSRVELQTDTFPIADSNDFLAIQPQNGRVAPKPCWGGL